MAAGVQGREVDREAAGLGKSNLGSGVSACTVGPYDTVLRILMRVAFWWQASAVAARGLHCLWEEDTRNE